MNKKEKCYKIFDENLEINREKAIKLVMNKLGLDQMTAETYYPLWRKALMDKPGYICPKKEKKEVNQIQKDKQFKYIDDPAMLMKLKQTHTYKEIAKMYNTYPNKIYENIKFYKQVHGGIEA